MGCLLCPNAKFRIEDSQNVKIRTEVTRYLEEEIDSCDLWETVDTDQNKMLTSDELDHLLLEALNYFQSVRGIPYYDAETAKPQIEEIRNEITTNFDQDGDTSTISFEEFSAVGRYLKVAYNNTLRDIAGHKYSSTNAEYV